jgi:hypothetical protein
MFCAIAKATRIQICFLANGQTTKKMGILE